MIVAMGFVVLAGAGAVARAEIGHVANRSFPMGTMAVNVTGAFALGLLAGAGDPMATVVGTAGLGALTTFSSFARDTVALVEERRPTAAAVYIGLTVIVGIAAAAGGLVLAGS